MQNQWAKLSGFLWHFPLRGTLDRLWFRGALPFLTYLNLPWTLPDGNRLWTNFPFGGIQFIIDDIYKRQVYDRHFGSKIGFIVFDVGAHIGIYSLKTAKQIGEKGKVFAFEPEAGNFRLLCRNVKVNKYRNIIPINFALGDFEGRTDLFLSAPGSGLHSFNRADMSGRKKVVLVTTVDKLMHTLSVKHVDLMKIDVEGAELEVLKGAENSLKLKRIIRLAVATYHKVGETDKVKGFLEGFHYQIFTHDFGGCGGQYLYAVTS